MTAFLCIFALVFTGIWLYQYSRTPGPQGPPEVVVLIPQGISFEKIVEILVENGVIYNDVRFQLLARIQKRAGKIQAGEFVLHTGRLPGEILEELANAKPLQHKITIPEGLRAGEIAEILSEGNWSDTKKIAELVHDQEFIASVGLQGNSSLEGYLFPDTYYITRIPAFSEEDIITMMVRRFFQVWNELQPGDSDMRDIVILASIIEKETAAREEMPLIASVFRNRLHLRMRLQSDPTVIYGIENFSGNLTKKDLQTVTPYNTYTNFGLPPGPICNPGRRAINAALHPANEKYLYFVSKNDGTHFFSTTLNQHNRAVFKYQKNRDRKKGDE